MVKKYIVIIIVLFEACQPKDNRIVILAKYPDGKMKTSVQYFHLNDTLKYSLKEYFQNGELYHEATVNDGTFIGRKIKYFGNRLVAQIDSLFVPQVIGSKNWTGMVTRFYSNGVISQRYLVKNGKMNGIFQNYKDDGIISKEYEVIDDTIKNGIYTEYHSNGVRSYQTTYILGEHHGMEYYFNLSGDTTEYVMYRDGENKFPYKKWLKGGVFLIGNYSNKQETKAKWLWINKTGIILKTKDVYNPKHEFPLPE